MWRFLLYNSLFNLIRYIDLISCDLLAVDLRILDSILGDDRLKVFITHGGLNSVLETVRAGKPMVVLPLFGMPFCFTAYL